MGRVFLYAAFVPPAEILDEVWDLAAATSVDAGTVPPPPGRAGRRKAPRRLGRKPKQETVVDLSAPVLDLEPAREVNLAMAKFGNLALNDANRLAAALQEASGEWPSPRLQLKGYSTGEAENDASVWVDLDGDLDELNTIVRGVHEIAKGLRFFVDRRVFRPRVRLGGVRPTATEPQLEALLAKLERFETSPWWQTEFGLLTLVDQGPDLPGFRSFADIPLGPHVAH
jgi:hypothetical protein